MAKKEPNKQELKIQGKTITVSNLDKVFFNAGGFTKGQVIDYYIRVAKYMLPHLKNRPCTLKRYPNGVHGEFFYEKNAPGYTPAWVKRFPVPRRTGGPDIMYILVNDVPTLVWCANIGTIEFHPFLHRAPHIERPTHIVFDLDPGEGMTVLECVDVAFILRDILSQLKLQSFAKVSGSKGIQVYVPLNTATTYDVTQVFARTLAQLLERQHSDLVVSEMAKVERRNRIFIDWSQNADFKTTVAVYSMRAKRHRPYISVPVGWDELKDARDQGDSSVLDFGPEAALARCDKLGDLFEPVLNLKQRLPKNFVDVLEAGSPARRSVRGPVRKSVVDGEPAPSRQGSRRGFALKKSKNGFELQLDARGGTKSWRVREGAGLTEDAGTYEFMEADDEKDRLHLFMEGSRLRGEWLLAKSGRTWELQEAGNKEAQTEFIEPMKALLVADLPEGDNWQYEIKLDGYRAEAIRVDGDVALLSRRNNDLATRFPHIAKACQALGPGTIVDGEVVALDEHGRPSFNLLQNYQSKTSPIVYYVFDILEHHGKKLLKRPLVQRREILEQALKNIEEPVRLLGTLDGSPSELKAAAKKQHIEGLVAKRRNSVYAPGERSGAWVKYKVNKSQELVIGGYLPGKDGFDSLLAGYYERDKLMFIGKVKNGFTPRLKRHVAGRFAGLETERCPFDNLPEPKGARRGEALTADVMKKCRWLKPELVAQVEFTDWTAANHLRHSRFGGLRDDKEPKEVVHEVEADQVVRE